MIRELKYQIIGEERHDVSLFGAIPDEGELLIRLVFTGEKKIESVRLFVHSDSLSEPAGNRFREFYLSPCGNDIFEKTIRLSDLSVLTSSGLLYYRYDIVSEEARFSLGGDGVTELWSSDDYGERQLLIYDRNFKTPSFIKEGPIYHIFVDRFATSRKYPVKPGARLNPDWEGGMPEFAPYRGAPIKNNDFFGGDLTGAAEKIEHIAALGVRTVYLSPVFESPSNHKYDTSDYMSVDSMFGGDSALAEFIEKCHEHGIDVILDGVFNHTGDDSIYFDRCRRYGGVGAYCTKDSPYFEWYNFTKYPDEYECWWGIGILPRVNSSVESFRRFILGDGGVIEKYMKMGVAGFRLDVADELPDVFLDELREKVKREDENAVVIGEVWEDASNKVAYSQRRRYLAGRQLDSVMNYPLRDGVISFIKYGDHERLKHIYESVYRHYPKCVSDALMNFLGTHDTERIITVLAGESPEGKSPAELASLRLTGEQKRTGRELVKCAFTLVATSYGTPSVFYGDEAGLEGYHDPFCRMPYPWGHEDGELLAFYKALGSLRRRETIFREGYFRVVNSGENFFVTERFEGTSSVYTVVARAEGYRFNPLRPVKVLLDSRGDAGGDYLYVPPYTARIFKSN